MTETTVGAMPRYSHGGYRAPGSYTDGRSAPRRANGVQKGAMHARMNVCLTKRQWAYVTQLAEGSVCSAAQIVREILDGRLNEIEKSGEMLWTGEEWAFD